MDQPNGKHVKRLYGAGKRCGQIVGRSAARSAAAAKAARPGCPSMGLLCANVRVWVGEDDF
jgi:hypothetical protein